MRDLPYQSPVLSEKPRCAAAQPRAHSKDLVPSSHA